MNVVIHLQSSEVIASVHLYLRLFLHACKSPTYHADSDMIKVAIVFTFACASSHTVFLCVFEFRNEASQDNSSQIPLGK